MKRIILSLIALFSVLLVQGQSSTHTVSIDFSNGLSSLLDQPKVGKSKVQWGYQVALGYTYLHNEHFGFSVRGEYAYMHNKYSLPNFKQAFESTDMEGEVYLQKNSMENYTENQKIHYLNIPLMFRYEFMPLYLEVGPIVGFNLASDIKSHAALVKTSGRYADALEDFENIPELGFFTQTNYSADNKVKLGLNLSLGFEFGYLFEMSHSQFGIAFLAQFGVLNFGKKKADQTFINTEAVNGMPELKVNPISTSLLEANSTSSVSGWMMPLFVGLKLSYRVKLERSEYSFFSRKVAKDRE